MFYGDQFKKLQKVFTLPFFSSSLFLRLDWVFYVFSCAFPTTKNSKGFLWPCRIPLYSTDIQYS